MEIYRAARGGDGYKMGGEQGWRDGMEGDSAERDKCWMIDGKETKKDPYESGGKRGEVGTKRHDTRKDEGFS